MYGRTIEGATYTIEAHRACHVVSSGLYFSQTSFYSQPCPRKLSQGFTCWDQPNETIAAPEIRDRPMGKELFLRKHEGGGERAGKPSGHPDFCVCWSRSLPITITLSCIPNLLQLPWGAGRICIQPGLQRLCFRKSWQVSHSRATTALPSL